MLAVTAFRKVTIKATTGYDGFDLEANKMETLCPFCQQKQAISETAIRKPMRCPNCQRTFTANPLTGLGVGVSGMSRGLAESRATVLAQPPNMTVPMGAPARAVGSATPSQHGTSSAGPPPSPQVAPASG